MWGLSLNSLFLLPWHSSSPFFYLFSFFQTSKGSKESTLVSCCQSRSTRHKLSTPPSPQTKLTPSIVHFNKPSHLRQGPHLGVTGLGPSLSMRQSSAWIKSVGRHYHCPLDNQHLLHKMTRIKELHSLEWKLLAKELKKPSFHEPGEVFGQPY